MNCEQIRELLASYMIEKLSGKAGAELPDQVLAHLLGCRECREQLEVMTSVAGGTTLRLGHPLCCEELMELFPEMVEVEESLLPTRYPAAWLHLAACPECRQVYAMARANLAAEGEADFARVRQAALPFVPAGGAVWQKATPLVHKLAGTLTVLIERGKDALQLVPEWLAQCVSVPVPAAAFRSDPAEAAYDQEVSVADQENGRRIVLRMRPRGGKVDLQVRLVATASGDTLGEVPVALLDERGRFLMQLVSSAGSGGEGGVRFNDCLPGQYLLRVSEDQRSWELALHLT